MTKLEFQRPLRGAATLSTTMLNTLVLATVALATLALATGCEPSRLPDALGGADGPPGEESPPDGDDNGAGADDDARGPDDVVAELATCAVEWNPADTTPYRVPVIDGASIESSDEDAGARATVGRT